MGKEDDSIRLHPFIQSRIEPMALSSPNPLDLAYWTVSQNPTFDEESYLVDLRDWLVNHHPQPRTNPIDLRDLPSQATVTSDTPDHHIAEIVAAQLAYGLNEGEVHLTYQRGVQGFRLTIECQYHDIG